MSRWRLALETTDPDASPAAKLRALGAEYETLVRDVHGLRLILQSFSSSEDPDVRASSHRCLKSMFAWLTETTGAPPAAIQQFFAYGMMLTVAASIQAADIAGEEQWARMFVVIPIE
jgi:hypothetical protein